MSNKTADQLLQEMAEEALKVQNARAPARGKEIVGEQPATLKNKPDDHPAQGETSKRARPEDEAGYRMEEELSTGESPDVEPLHSDADAAEGFATFVERTLGEELPRRALELREATALSTHALHLIYRPACEEAQLVAEKEADAKVIREQASRIKEYQIQLSQEVKKSAELSRKVANLSLMQPMMKKCRQEW